MAKRVIGESDFGLKDKGVKSKGNPSEYGAHAKRETPVTTRDRAVPPILLVALLFCVPALRTQEVPTATGPLIAQSAESRGLCMRQYRVEKNLAFIDRTLSILLRRIESFFFSPVLDGR